MKRGRTYCPVFQIEYKVILETFLRWVRTSANFEEIPWLSFGSKVPKLPSTWNTNGSSTFLTAESSSSFFNDSKNSKLFFLRSSWAFYALLKRGRTFSPVSLLHSRKFEGSIFYSSVTFPVSSNFFPRSMMYCLRSSLTCGCFKA